jgi:hypothetical protein
MISPFTFYLQQKFTDPEQKNDKSILHSNQIPSTQYIYALYVLMIIRTRTSNTMILWNIVKDRSIWPDDFTHKETSYLTNLLKQNTSWQDNTHPACTDHFLDI